MRMTWDSSFLCSIEYPSLNYFSFIQNPGFYKYATYKHMAYFYCLVMGMRWGKFTKARVWDGETKVGDGGLCLILNNK
jgi:hypothetical protein